MPNGCYNKLIITGPDIPALLNQIGTKDCPLSFEKLIPMPDPIKVISGNYAELAIAAALLVFTEKIEQMKATVRSYCSNITFSRIMLGYLEDALDDSERMRALSARILSRLDKGLLLSDFYSCDSEDEPHSLTLVELAEVGNQYLENISNFGALSSYDWSLRNWDMKWDMVDDMEVLLQEQHCIILFFDTSWCPPIKIIKTLGIRFPEYKFRLTWYEPCNGYQGCVDISGQTANLTEYELYSEEHFGNDFGSLEVPPFMQWKIEA
jgi:hypothetical protein